MPEELVCLVSKAHWDANDEARAEALIAGTQRAWPAFWGLVIFNGVEVLAVQKLQILGVPNPEQIQIKVQKIRETNLRRREQFLRVLSDCRQSNLKVYFLKGFLLGETVYQDPCYKKMSDIDILVHQKEVLEIVDIFKKSGFRFVGNLFGKNPVDFRLHHSPPLMSPNGEHFIGLHWGLSYPFSPRHPTTDIFKNCHENALCDAYNLLHLCMHLPFFKIGLRELVDVANLGIFVRDRVDFDDLFRTAKAWNCEDAVYRVFSLSHAVIPWLPEAAYLELQKIEKKFSLSRYVTDTQSRVKDKSLLLRSRSEHVGKIERHFMLFRLAHNYSDRVYHLKKQWALFWFPDRLEQKRLLATSSIKASLAIWFALAQDLGALHLTLISFRNVFSLFFFNKKPSGEMPVEVLQAITAR